MTKAPAQTARTPAKVTKSASTASRSVKGGTAAKPSTPTTASTAVKPATTATARRAAPLSPRKFVTIPTLPQGVKTYLVAGVTPIYTARGARVESFRSPTDTILLVQLDPGANVVRTLSLPRDTLLGSSGSRINSVLPRSGADALVRTVTAMTGVGIDAYVLVNLRGVRDLTDAAGGVTLTVGKAMNYDDFAGKLHIHFQPGRQTLGGQKAEEFLRFRHDARGDIGRIDRTRDFLQALTLRLLTPSGLERLPRVSAAVRANSRTTLSERDYQDILGFAMKRPKLQTFVLPGRNEGAYWRMDPGRAGGVLAAFRSPVQAKR
ncbi:LCP family protein [Deinococcus yavapaiensis]|uniref:LCP family protein n=1 Tax=Deinococcus yavapaiensis TaxID=309889 RepID=UPI0011B4F4AA|nr:LCP family protein [Deinococcus yavapaiensis]